jgi:preprotein translocase subunit SecG
MVILLTIIHVVVCFFLVVVVLLQSGKAADLAGAFGGMGSQTAFGPRGSATVLSKATTIAAALFMVTSLSLAIMASRATGGASSVVERSKGAAPKQSTPATPAPAPAKPGAQPSVTVTPLGPGGEKGPGQTTPLDLEKLPKVPAQPQSQPQKK